MPEQAADAAGEGQAHGQQSWEDRLWSIGKNILMFMAIQYAFKAFMGGGSQKAAVPTTPDNTAQAVDPVGPPVVYPMWPTNSSLDVALYISDSLRLPPFDNVPSESRILYETDFYLNRKDNDREVHANFGVPKSVQNNKTLWAHIFVGQHGAELDPLSSRYDSTKAYRMMWPLTQYYPKKKVRKTRNLLEAQDENQTIEEEQEPAVAAVASYYHPNFTLSFISESPAVQLATTHPAMRQYYVLHNGPGPEHKPDASYFYPVLYINTFWQLRSHMTELNMTVPIDRLDMNVKVSTLSNWQFGIMAAMDEGMKDTARKAAQGQSTPGGGDGSELELIKETLLDTNPWLLGTTVVVSLLHMVFELLAFSSDVGHWRKKKDNVGVSVRTILSNVVMQTIIFLYLMDNNEHTSWMILGGQAIGIVIEFWKITKTVNVRVRAPTPGSWAHGILPRIVVFEDKHQLSETEEKTEEYDRIAFKYMGIVAVPLLLAYAGYSLVYESHKSWYSFIIATLVGSVYAYGFLMMVPSLYINYRLKSVAHMPAKTMMYKFLNTFIDDLFAFTIKMPLLHRLATLRDDVIFFVYLYQAWAYKVDYTRVNEFGQGGDEEEVADKKANKPLQAPANGSTKAIKENEVTATKASGREKGSAKKRKA